MFKKAIIATAAAAIAATAVIADGHIDPAISGAIKARQSHMQLYAHNIGILGGMAKGATDYDSEKASIAAANISTLATINQSSYWPQGSDAGSVEGTRALAAIWQNFPDVGAKAGALVDASDSMAAAAGTDLAALQVAMGALGGACGGCHKAYRQPE